MKWIDVIDEALYYIEENITEDISIEKIAANFYISPFYFQKGFTMLCGYTIGEYIRNRRLSLAAIDLINNNENIIDIALKYGYESPDSFTKAFTRFHGVTPSAVRKDKAMIKSFSSLKINFSLKGGFVMDYKILEKDSFTIMGASKTFKYSNCMSEIPKFWNNFYKEGKGQTVCGMYGISFDKKMGGEEFEYFIADNYIPWNEVPEGFVTKVIPKHTWAVFPCKGAMPDSLQSVNKNIFSEWLPNCKEYEIAEGINIEMYADPKDFPKGTSDENYYSEIWIPIKKK